MGFAPVQDEIILAFPATRITLYFKMVIISENLNLAARSNRPFRVVVAFLACFVLTLGGLQQTAAVRADEAKLDMLFAELAEPDLENWEDVEDKIWKEWSKSGSRSMDLLLERGRAAMASGDLGAAIDHLSALIDHAPEFAEGWNARATAFFMMNEFGLSVADIQQTLILNPRHFGAMSGLGNILEQTGRFNEALTVYSKALEVHPHQTNIKAAIERVQVAVGGSTL
jgi:tetratricopeptide (TPR) repeat protein